MAPNQASRWSPQDYAANAAFVPALGAPALALLAPKAGERILDLGCGDGVLTAKLIAAGAEVLGVDASEEMVAAARVRGINARVANGEALSFDCEFDAVFSNAALHWMLDPVAVASSVFRALKPGGRFAGEMGGAGNIRILRVGIRTELRERGYALPADDPQWYASVAEFTRVYEAAGFEQVAAQLIPRETDLPSGVSGWVNTFRAGWLDVAGVPEAVRADIAEAVERRLAPMLQRADGSWFADYVRLRFTMRKPV